MEGKVQLESSEGHRPFRLPSELVFFFSFFCSHAIRYQLQGKLQVFGTLSQRLGGDEDKQEVNMDATGKDSGFVMC